MTLYPDPSVEPSFPEQIFGNSVLGLMMEEIVRVEKLPPEFVAPFLLGAVSAAAARGLQVESFRGKHALPNLYIALEAESGIGKSEVGKHAFGPLYDVDTSRRERFQQTELPSFSARHRILELKIQKAEKAEHPSPTFTIRPTANKNSANF